jgi:8-oxo-dGTP diphosphatase
MSERRALTTDAIIELDGGVLLLERNHPPDEECWVLPGGFVERNETTREACVRETKEEVGVDVTVEEFVGLYDDPNRDERGTVTAAYRCTPVDEATPEPREEAHRVETFDPTELPEMGFDHGEIVIDAMGV